MIYSLLTRGSHAQVAGNSSLVFAGTYHVYSVDWTQDKLTW